jgi:hypothetical protein
MIDFPEPDGTDFPTPHDRSHERITVPGGWIYHGLLMSKPVYVPDPDVWAPGSDTARILAAVNDLRTEIASMSQTLQGSIDTLIADNVALKAAVDGAPAAIATLVAAAIAAAATAGATPAQLQAMADLHTALGGETAELSAALAGTPPAVPTA